MISNNTKPVNDEIEISYKENANQRSWVVKGMSDQVVVSPTKEDACSNMPGKHILFIEISILYRLIDLMHTI